jgi:hypothetical protein
LLNLEWLLIGAAFLVALGAWLRARRLSRRLERLTESYWELRYEYGQLRARVTRLEPPGADGADAASASPIPGVAGVAGVNDPREQGRPAGTIAFVPLSSLKR